MRIAIVSDVHGSLGALEAVIADLHVQSPDIVVHGGDLVLSGGRPAEVVDLIRSEGWVGVLGNTDELLWSREGLEALCARAPQLERLFQILLEDFVPATRALLGAERVEWLRALPAEWRTEDLCVLHASPDDLWWAPMQDAADRSLVETYGNLAASVVVYGHIHRPFVRRVGNLTVANSGSVGMSYDGDPRASYLVITDGVIQVRRVERDLEREARDLLQSRYPHAAWLADVCRKGMFVPLPEA